MNASRRLQWLFTTEGETLEIKLERGGRANHWRVACNGRVRDYAECRIGVGGVFAYVDGCYTWARIEKDVGRTTLVFIGGEPTVFLDRIFDLVGAEAGYEIRAPLPGKVVAVTARTGAHVRRGEPLLSLEAMKMEHALKAPRDGIVAEIAVKAGAQVKEGALLVRLEEGRNEL
jgi:acetyl/propionyl-CoA carboxylase alpha subunit